MPTVCGHWMIATARKCLRLLDTDKRGRWAFLVMLGVVASIFETVGAILILLVMRLAQDPGAPLDLPVLGDVRARFSDVAPSTFFAWLCVVTGVFFVVRAVVVVGQTYMQHRLAQNAGVRLAARLLEGYLRESYEEHVQKNSSVMIRNISESIHSLVSWTLLPLLSIATEAFMVAGVVVVLVAAAPVASVIGTAFLGIQVLLMLRVLRPRLSALGVTSQDMAAASLEALQQSLHGFREVRLLGRTGAFVGTYNERRSLLARVQYAQAALVTIPRLVVETTFIVGLLAFLGLRSGQASSPRMVALLGLFAYAVLRVMPSVNRIVMSIGNLRFGGAAVDELTAEVDRMDAEARDRPRDLDAPAARPLRTVLEARGVVYRYPGTDVDVLAGVDVVVERGQYVGLVGSTGSGKSTLVDVLIGLLRPTAGTVLVDGVELEADVAGWQASVGVVSQSVYLLDETLRRNIAFGVRPEEIDDDQVAGAVGMAQLDALVRSLPLGLDTVVGERGVRLSGGQRQRVAIARALYHRPSVLFFDEGTSALDTLTEAEVMAAIEQLRGDRTVIAVAHRLSTVRACDLIYLLDAGRVVDSGTFDELEQRSAAFRRMAR